MPSRRGVTIRVGDRSRVRQLRYTHEALERLEIETERTLDEHAQRLLKGSAVSITALVWAGLIHAEPDLSRSDVSAMLDTTRYEEYALAIAEASKLSFGKGEEEATDEGNAAAAMG